MYKSKYFKPTEYLPSGFTDSAVMDDRILKIADEIREYIKKPLTINANGRNWCGYRTKECKIGAKKSLHRFGKALDLHCEDMSAEEIRKMILAAAELGHFAELGRMEAGVDWVHIDLGSRKNGKIYLFKQ